MAQNSPIEWTQQTWNPLAGCTIKSPGCLRCYAATMSGRLERMGQAKYAGTTVKKGKQTIFTGVINYDERALYAPLRRRRPTTYFVNSMSDLFWGDDHDLETARSLGVEDPKPVPSEFIDKVLAVMALTPQHTYQVLTKRPGRAVDYFLRDELIRWGLIEGNAQRIHFERTGERPEEWLAVHGPLPNLWLGVSAEDQKRADERIPLLVQTPAAVQFVSYEPALGPIDFSKVPGLNKAGSAGHDMLRKLWIIIGGESGTGARPFDISWARSVIQQCRVAGVPVFVKQLGKYAMLSLRDDATGVHPTEDSSPSSTRAWNRGDFGERLKLNDPKGGDMNEWPEDLRVREFPEVRDVVS